MSELKKHIGKVDKEIAQAKKTREKQKARVKIVRSYKGDTTAHEALVAATSRGIEASEARRDALVDERESEGPSQPPRKK